MDAFGPGILKVTRTDVANSTPIDLGFAQELSIDFAGTIKELYGNLQLPLDAARGTIKVNAKAKAAVISGTAWNNLFFGNSFSAGTVNWAPNENHNVPGVSTYTITVTNSGTFLTDLGVTYAATGLQFIKVTSLTAVGQYTVAAGVYTFYSGDANANVNITYAYTVAGSGQTLTLANQLIGSAPIFQLDYYTTRNNLPLIATFYQGQASKMGIAFKLEDFLMPEFELSLFANAAGNLGKLYFPQIN